MRNTRYRDSRCGVRLVFGLATSPTPIAELMGAQRPGDSTPLAHAHLLASDD